MTSYTEIYQDVLGDSTLYAGMLLAVGDDAQAEYLTECVGIDGQVWRNPAEQLAGKDYSNSSSRDMFMGVMLAAASGYVLPLIAAVDYLRKNDGLLCPSATDNRNKLGIVGWAQIGQLLGKYAFSHLGLRYWLYYKLLSPFLGLIAFVEGATVYKGYQVNLVYCTLMMYQKLGVHKWWTKQSVRYLQNVRQMPDLVLSYLAGDKQRLKDETPHMWNRHRRAMKEGHIVSWPVDAWYFTSEFPSHAYCRWVEFAGKEE